jgi:prepilin-type N-terminal cleavage/methylation domain-containing protein
MQHVATIDQRLFRAGQRASSSLRRKQSGFSLMELLIVVAIILIIAMVAIPNLTKQLMQAREMAAVREINSIHQAQTQYYSQFGRYANNLAELGPPASGAEGPSGAGLLPASLSGGKKGGHIFTLTVTQTGYAIAVGPERYNSDGRRNFYSDQSLEVHEKWGPEPATLQDPIMGSAGQAAPAE